MRHSWKQEKATQNKHRNMNKQDNKQPAQTTTNNNNIIHVFFVFVFCYVCYARYQPIKEQAA